MVNKGFGTEELEWWKRNQLSKQIEFGERLRERREYLGLSQAETARKAGVNQAQISRYENGHSPRDLATTLAVAHAYRLTEKDISAWIETLWGYDPAIAQAWRLNHDWFLEDITANLSIVHESIWKGELNSAKSLKIWIPRLDALRHEFPIDRLRVERLLATTLVEWLQVVMMTSLPTTVEANAKDDWELLDSIHNVLIEFNREYYDIALLLPGIVEQIKSQDLATCITLLESALTQIKAPRARASCYRNLLIAHATLAHRENRAYADCRELRTWENLANQTAESSNAYGRSLIFEGIRRSRDLVGCFDGPELIEAAKRSHQDALDENDGNLLVLGQILRTEITHLVAHPDTEPDTLIASADQALSVCYNRFPRHAATVISLLRTYPHKTVREFAFEWPHSRLITAN